MYPKKRRWSESFSPKGQITVFIIIGIVILFLFAGILYFTKYSIQDSLVSESKSAQDTAPQAFKPIAAYTEDCLYQTAKRGTILLGSQGGYIYPDVVGTYSARDPTNADGINLEPTKVPYWHYNKNPNSDFAISLASAKPQLHKKDDPEMSIESQLERYITEKVDNCINNYASFTQQGFTVTEADPLSTKVFIRSGSIYIELTKPIDATLGDDQQEFQKFTTTIPIDIDRYYELASGITESQLNYTFLEKQALDLIQVFSAVDVNKLPPTTATTFELVPTISWTKVQVEQDLKQMLTSYVPTLQLVSSANFYRYEYPVQDLSALYQKTYDNMILPIPGAEQLEVRFNYYDFPLYAKINDGGATIAPNSLAVHYNILHFGTQQFSTVYDVSYPVLASIYDPSAFDGEGYLFNFALESNIRGNSPASADQVIPKLQKKIQRSLLCNENQRSTEPIRTLIIDSYTKEPIEAVQLGFTIPEQDTCIMGVTKDDGVIEESYPAVYGGTISLIKQDYLTDFYPIDTYKRKDNPSIFGYASVGRDEPVLELNRITAKNITIKKKMIEKCIDNDHSYSINVVEAGGAALTAGAAADSVGTAVGAAQGAGSSAGITANEDGCYFSPLLGATAEEAVDKYRPELLDATHYWVYTGAKQVLLDGERAIVTLKRVSGLNPKSNSQEFIAVATLEGGQLQTEVDLVPGVYEVSAFLTTSNPVVIPKEERCSEGVLESISCWDSDGCCFTLDEQKADQFVLGQLDWSKEKEYLTITPENLYGSSEIEFYVPYMNIYQVPQKAHKRVVEDLAAVGRLSNISRDLRAQLEPSYR